MSTASREPRQSADENAASASDMANKLAGTISSGIDEAARTAKRFAERLKGDGASLHEELSEAGEHFGDEAKRIGTLAAETIRAHPVAAFGIAFALGVIATRLLQRR